MSPSLGCLHTGVHRPEDLRSSLAGSEKQPRAAVCMRCVRFTGEKQRSRLSHIISWLKTLAHTAYSSDKVFIAVGEI